MLMQPRNTSMHVDVQTGGFEFHTVDLVIPAKGLDFRFERWHSSMAAFNQIFHAGWQFDWDERLTFDPADSSVRYWTQGLRMQRFVLNPDGTYSPAVGWTYSTLNKMPNGQFEIILKSQGRRLFDGSTGRLLRREDTNGNFQTFSWPGNMYPSEIRDTAGRLVVVTQEMVAGVDIVTVTDWIGRTLKYEIPGGAAITGYTDPEGNVIRYTSNTQGINFVGLESITLPNGLWVTNYPFALRPQQTMVGRQVFGNGREIVYDYDQVNLKTTVTDGGRVSLYEWNTAGDVIRKTDPIGNVWAYEYDSGHRVTKITDPNLATIEKAYDAKGNLVYQKDQKGNVWRNDYDPTFNKVTFTMAPAPFSYVRGNTYNPTTGNLEETAGTVANRFGGFLYGQKKYGFDPAVKTTYEHYSDGLLKKITDPNGNSTQFAYNTLGRPTSVTNGLNKTTTFEVDAVGNRVAVIDPLGNRTSFIYDKLNRPTSMTTPLGHISRWRYDGNGNTVLASDPLNRTTQRKYSVMDELLTILDPAGGKVGYSYDKFHNVVEQVDPNGNPYIFARDVLGRITSVIDPMGQETQTEYDPYCGRYTETDPIGDHTSYVNDVTCLRTQRIFEDESSFQFDWDELGRRVRMTQPQWRKYGEFVYGPPTYGSSKYGEFRYGAAPKYGHDPQDDTTFTWDNQNRLVKVSYPGGNDISMEYDLGGRLTNLTDIQGVATAYDWDSANRLAAVTRAGKTTTYAYDDADRTTILTYPNGVTCDFTYDDDSRIIRMLWKKGATVLYDILYTCDAVGSRIKKSLQVGAASPVVEDYTFDALSRLTHVCEDGALKTHFRFDPVGNRLLKETASGEEWSDYDASDELVVTNGLQFRWDPTGQLLEKSATDAAKPTILAWNYGHRLRQVVFPDSTTSTYRYSGDELRIYRKDTAGVETHYFWLPSGILDLSQVLNETDGSGNARASYVLGSGRMIAIVDPSGNEHYYVFDALGSVLGLTDGSGALTDTYSYDEYGVPTGEAGTTYNPIRFTGQQWDAESESYYLRLRYYAPKEGRFTRREPGTSLPRGNAYAFAAGNPVLLVDPTGEEPISPPGFPFRCVPHQEHQVFMVGPDNFNVKATASLTCTVAVASITGSIKLESASFSQVGKVFFTSPLPSDLRINSRSVSGTWECVKPGSYWLHSSWNVFWGNPKVFPVVSPGGTFELIYVP